MQDYIPREKDINEVIEPIVIKQYDNNSRLLHVKFNDIDLSDVDNQAMDLNECTTKLYIEPEDNTDQAAVNFVEGTVESAENGTLTFLLPGGVTQNVGTYDCEIWIYGGDETAHPIISSRPFKLTVLKSIRNDSAIEASPDFSALDEIIIQAQETLERVDAASEAIAGFEKRQIDNKFNVKPVFMGEISGYAAQSMAIIDQDNDSDIYLIGFSKKDDDSTAKLLVYHSGTNSILSSADFSFGHANTMAIDENGIVYISNDNKRSIYRFTVTSYSPSLTISQQSAISIANGWNASGVFTYNGVLYVYGEHDNKNYYWQPGNEEGAVEIVIPEEKPRIEQAWATDDNNYLYVLRSSPNAIAAYDIETGTFIRWIEIGDYIGATYPIGEIETICINSNQEMMLLSQLYYDLPDKNNRFWLLSKLKPSRDMPEDQQHKYPGEELLIYVSNANAGKMAFVTNPNNPQSGSVNYPYPSLESALYAAAAKAANKVKIVMKSTGTNYVIDYLALNFPLLDILIHCSGNVTFKELILQSGQLTITGNATFEKIVNSPNSSLSIDGGTYSGGERINDTAPYQLYGNLALINSNFTGTETITEDNVDREIPSTQTVFQFNGGSTGVVGFTAGTAPHGTNFQQTNLTLLGVKTAGIRERWTTIYNAQTASTPIQIGTNIPLTSGFYVNNDIIIRIKWQMTSENQYYNTVISVSGNTVTDCHYIIHVDKAVGFDISMREVKFLTMPRVFENDNLVGGTIKIISVNDYPVYSATTRTIRTSGDLPEGMAIATIEVKGY